MKLVIIESPYAGDVPRNLLYLRSCIRDCLARGESPYASHRMLTDALDDNDINQRVLGINAGLAWRLVKWIDNDSQSHRVAPIFYIDLGWSDGMKYARDLYNREKITYEERHLWKNDPFFNATR